MITLGSVDLSRLLLHQLVWYVDKTEHVTCSLLHEQAITPTKFQTSAAFIPLPLEDARFRKTEQIIIKAHFLLRVIPLKTP